MRGPRPDAVLCPLRGPVHVPVLPWPRPRGRRGAAPAAGRARVQRRAHARPRPPRRPKGTPRWWRSPSSGISAYADRRPLPPGRAHDAVVAALGELVEASAGAAAGCSWSARRCGREGGRVQLRRGRSTAGACSASCPRATCPTTASTTRSASSGRRARRSASEVELLGADGAVRRRHPVRRRATSRASRCTWRSARTCGRRSRRAPTARWRARPCWRTCRRSNITVGKADYRRTLCAAHSARHDRRLHLHRRRRGRVDHRPGLGRPGADLRERRPARRGRALRRRRAAHLRRPRPRPDRRRPREHEQLRRLDPRPPRAARAASGASSSSSADRRAAGPAARAAIERFPYVPADPATRSERCEEVYNIQVRGLETRLRAPGSRRS